MTKIADLMRQGKVGFTVYSPDAVRSQLLGNLDHHIHKATGFRAGFRHWIQHDVASISRFYGGEPSEEGAKKTIYDYDKVPAEELQYGHLVVKMFITGPCLFTLWYGENVIERLLAVKGKTQASQAAGDSIRGSFWCDNGVTNLTHTSDNIGEAKRELMALGLSHLLDQEKIERPLIAPHPNPQAHISHSGSLAVCRLVNRALITQEDTDTIAVDLPESGNARETMQVLKGRLEVGAKAVKDHALSDFIHAYLAGDLIAVSHALQTMPTTWWERFVIQCGVITRYTWHEIEAEQ